MDCVIFLKLRWETSLSIRDTKPVFLPASYTVLKKVPGGSPDPPDMSNMVVVNFNLFYRFLFLGFRYLRVTPTPKQGN